MKKEAIYRIGFISLAILLGMGIVYILSIAGNKSKGPIENFLDSVQQGVQNIENSLLIEDRVYKRKSKLLWLEKYNIEELRNPTEILMGASDNSKKESYETILNLEDSLNTTFPIIHIYNAWGSKKSEEFPKLAVQTIVSMGSIPMVTWEPWLGDFDEEEFIGIPSIDKRDKQCLKAIADGTYDKYIREWAQDLKKINSPIYIRLAHEMNDPYRYPWGPQNNKPEDFIAAWQHVHNIFKEEGVKNALWVWSPHPSYKYFEVYYPGEKYVDFVGLGVLNFGTAASWSKWWTFEELFGNDYEDMAQFDKPIMIAEFGSLNVGGNRAKWFSDALKNLPTKFPQIKSILFFHYPADKTLTDKQISWYFIEDKDVLDSIKITVSDW